MAPTPDGQGTTGCPRSSNTGALPTEGELGSSSAGARTPAREGGGPGSSALVDWLQWTEHDADVVEVMAFLTQGAPEAEWVGLARSPIGGYGSASAWGDVLVCYDGPAGNGVHVVVPGKGCRQLESSGLFLGSVLARVVAGSREVINLGDDPAFARWCKGFSRLDVAIDDREGLLSTDRMRRAIRSGECVSRWQFGNGVEKFRMDGGEHAEVQTLYLGSAQSLLRACVYDKAEEQRVRGENPGDGVWMRFELRARDERGDQLGAVLLQRGMAGVARVLQGYVRFVVRQEHDENRWRWPAARWWERFIGRVERLSLTERPEERSYDDVRAWLSRQVSASVAMCQQVEGDDLGWFVALLEDGRVKMRERHRRIAAGAAVAKVSEAAITAA